MRRSRTALLTAAATAATFALTATPAFAAVSVAVAAADQESLTPSMTATPAGMSGTVTTHFYARRPGDSTWTLVNDTTRTGATGALVAVPIPTGKLSAGDGFQWQAKACTTTNGCVSSAIQTSYASPAVGAGDIEGATFLTRELSDTVTVKVNVGTGNLLVKTHELRLPGIGEDLELTDAFNSLNLATGSRYPAGSTGRGWRFAWADTVLIKNSTGTLSYFGPAGLVDLFRLKSGSTTSFTSVNGQRHHLDLLNGTDPNVPGSPSSSYRLTDHQDGTRYYFNTGLRLIAAYDRHQQKTTYIYDTSGHLTSIQSTRGGAGANTATFTYTTTSPARIASYTQTTATGPATSRTWSYGYDGADHLHTITDPAGRVTAFDYTGDDLTSITTAGDAQTTFTYDTDHRVTAFTQHNPASPGDATTRLDYTDATHTLVADANTDPGTPVASVTHAEYWLADAAGTVDRMGRVLRYLDPDNTDLTHPTLTRTFNQFGAVTTATDAYGHATTNAWSANGGESLTSTTLATGAVSSTAYANTNTTTNPTAAYQPSTATDPNGHARTYSYDTDGSLAATQDASSNKAQVSYHTDGTLGSSTDPGNGTNATTYTEDTSTHQLTGITPVTGSSLRPRTLTWDGFGRIATATTGKLDSTGAETTITYTYDQPPTGGIGLLDRVKTISYSDGTPTVTYSYTDDGQVATRTVGSVTTSYGYDPNGHQTSVSTSSGGGTLSYGYDKAGNLTSLTDGRGTTSYGYDPAERLTSMTDAFGHLTNFTNDKNGQRTDTWFATNAANTTWTAHTHVAFDNAGRLTTITTTRDSNITPASDTVSDLTYSYAAPGATACAGSPAADTDTDTRWQRTDTTDPANPVTSNYCYDKSNRLVDATNVSGHHYTYGYDANGNTTSVTVDGTTTSYPANPANQISKAGYTYDGAGNLTATPADTFTYNGANQTTSNDGSSARFAGPDQVERTHSYDGLDFVYGRAPEHGQLKGQPLLQSWNTLNGPAYIDRDPDGMPISLTFTGDTYYYVRDGLGSVIALVSAQDQGVVATYTYTPYGGLISGGSSGMGYTNRIRYTGGEYDIRTGYTHLGQRFYDPTTTKFSQQDGINRLADPANGNLYQYAAANPCNNTDLSGQSVGCALASGAVAGLAAFDAFGVYALVLAPTPYGWALWGTGTALSGLLSLFVEPWFEKDCVQ